MRILVTISRDYPHPEIAVRALMVRLYDPGIAMQITVVHGASHMDWLLAGAALALGFAQEPHPADWEHHRRAAGPIRNQEMVDAGADLCLAFISLGSTGARDCLRKAKLSGIRCTRFDHEGREEPG